MDVLAVSVGLVMAWLVSVVSGGMHAVVAGAYRGAVDRSWARCRQLRVAWLLPGYGGQLREMHNAVWARGVGCPASLWLPGVHGCALSR